MKRNELKQAFSPIPKDCYDALMSVAHSVKEERVMKRKLSVALVFAISLVLIAGAALAVALSFRDTAQQVIQTEQTEGYYEVWPEAEKIALVNALVSLGYTEKTPEIEGLLAGTLEAGDAVRAADEAVAKFTGLSVSEISFMGIMEAAWGPFEKWTKEEQAWYSQLMVDMNLQKDDHTLYTEPTGPVTEAEAVGIARRDTAAAWGVAESILDAYEMNTYFQVPEDADAGDKQAYWLIAFTRAEDMPREEALFTWFGMYIHPDTGMPRVSAERIVAQYRAQTAHAEDSLMVLVRNFEREHTHFRKMNHEERALWSETIRPEVQRRWETEPEFFIMAEGDYILLAETTFIYGVPDAEALAEEEALRLAQRVLVEVLEREEAEITFYMAATDIYYDITDSQKPLWKFLFHMPNEYMQDKALGAQIAAYYGDTRPLSYKVELDAQTGEVVRAFGLEWGNTNTYETVLETR